MRSRHIQIQLSFLLLLLIFQFGVAHAKDQGKTLWSVSYFGEGGEDYFHRPSDIEVDLKQALIYIADSGNNRIVVFDLEGNFLRTIGQEGQGPGEFSQPTGLYVDSESQLAVADYRNNRIQIFDAQGKFLRNINTKENRVADLLVIDGLYYTVSSFGTSGFNINMGSDAQTQPLVVVLDDSGEVVSEITITDFPEKQPFVRALKHRVNLSLSPDRRLFLPSTAMNLIQVFDLEGKRLAKFDRDLPFKPITPSLKSQSTGGDGENRVVQMIASVDMVSQSAKFGPDGRLYILGYIESLDKILKGAKDMRAAPTPALRFDVIDPDSFKVIRTLACDGSTRAFAVIESGRIICIHEDDAGELVLKNVQY
jgi:hypothetical protein